MKMRRKLCCIMSAVLALMICMPGGTAFAIVDGRAAIAARPGVRDASPVSLQQMIDETPDGGTVKIADDMEFESTVVIPAGKSITLTDDGTPRTITSTAEPMFKVEGSLAIAATADENLVLQGTATGASSQGAVATVTGKLDLKRGTLKGGVPTGIVEGTVAVFGGTFDMSGGVITFEQIPCVYPDNHSLVRSRTFHTLHARRFERTSILYRKRFPCAGEIPNRERMGGVAEC